ncbi:MAG: hypothetical protein MJ217_00310 [Bacilli bacterium]|nr:hypothetical protein [Bacilli bacterium]
MKNKRLLASLFLALPILMANSPAPIRAGEKDEYRDFNFSLKNGEIRENKTYFEITINNTGDGFLSFEEFDLKTSKYGEVYIYVDTYGNDEMLPPHTSTTRKASINRTGVNIEELNKIKIVGEAYTDVVQDFQFTTVDEFTFGHIDSTTRFSASYRFTYDGKVPENTKNNFGLISTFNVDGNNFTYWTFLRSDFLRNGSGGVEYILFGDEVNSTSNVELVSYSLIRANDFHYSHGIGDLGSVVGAIVGTVFIAAFIIALIPPFIVGTIFLVKGIKRGKRRRAEALAKQQNDD